VDPILNDSQRLILDVVRTFAENEVRPRAAIIDEADEFPRDLYQKLAQLGFIGAMLPESAGGLGSDTLTFAIIMEELARASASIANALAVPVELCMALEQHGTRQQRALVGSIQSGDLIPAFALTEAEAGSDAAAIKTTARREGGGWVIDGSKIYITHARVADLVVVLAVTSPGGGHRGISAFLVPGGTPGMRAGSKDRFLGVRGLATGELVFDGCRVDEDALLGEENRGFQLAMSNIDFGRIAMASLALGIAQACLEESVAYARTRRQFGQPIWQFQGVGFMLADMSAAVDAARQLIWKACRMRDAGLPYSKEASHAKLYASDIAMKAATDAVQVFGGSGYSLDSPVQRYFRDAKLTQIYEGTNQIQRMLIARYLCR
jgi:alkylation response protein AidB-like acyl-CoA dehydrogenase